MQFRENAVLPNVIVALKVARRQGFESDVEETFLIFVLWTKKKKFGEKQFRESLKHDRTKLVGMKS